MNIYDTKQIICSKCGKAIGEIEYDAKVIYPKCGACTDPLPGVDDNIYSLVSGYKNYLENKEGSQPLKKSKPIWSGEKYFGKSRTIL